MTTLKMLKLGQIVGFLLIACGVASCQFTNLAKLEDAVTMDLFFLGGGLLYGGCRLAAWLGSKAP